MEEFKRGAGPLLAAVIGTMCGMITITNYTQTFFVGPVTQEFGWSKGQFFLGFTCMMVTGLVTAPLFGALADRFGVRRLGIIGLIGHAASYQLISFNNGSLALWFASFVVLAVTAAGSLPIIWTKLINGWFVVNRGKAIGITMAGTGIGAFIFPPIVEAIVSAYGWRAGYQVVGLGAAVFSLPFVVALCKERTATDRSSDNPAAAAEWGATPADALRDYKFWILGLVLFLTVFVIVGLLSNFVPIFVEQGFNVEQIAVVEALLGIMVILGRVGIGVLLDRYWAPGVAIAFFTLPIIGLFLLTNVVVTFPVFLVVAVIVGLAAGAELDLLAYLTSRYFGTRHYGTIFGRIFAFFTVGAGIAPPIFGASADALGSYSPILTISIALLAFCLGLFFALGSYPVQDLQEPLHA